MPLPTSRTFLTTLINRLTTIPLNPPPPQVSLDTQTPNALSRIPLPHRHLVITLHVLFPNLLLPALDLLDRSLVQKLTLSDPNPNPRPPPIKIKTEPGLEQNPEDNDGDDGDGEIKAAEGEGVYVVYSTTQPPPSRKRKAAAVKTEDDHHHHHTDKGGGGGGGEMMDKMTGQKYLVHLTAWNCTCAAFAFSIVQSLLSESDQQPSSSPLPAELQLEDIGGEEAQDRQHTKWEFGGMSTDGLGENGGGVPICKHLLACLLAERWGDALGEYVTDKRVGKWEMAGVVADV
ncbi:hypothetical protein B0T21DRAFT_345646 [Apiosordaria backusii]|uniref:SWIM-type domain-containing protein n=1 Tax=Apiosordaria backusii TaxID=314023 RepID=A0AA40ELY3_9PEZI|nr:hypothetical protein B0T21DRAFT_345646 [Apiosordaria backusii]